MSTIKIANIRSFAGKRPKEGFTHTQWVAHIGETYRLAVKHGFKFGDDGRCYKPWTASSPLINGVRHHWVPAGIGRRAKLVPKYAGSAA